MTSLTLKYRPKKLFDIVGQSHVTAVLKAMVTKNSLPPVLIFAGASGTGKTTAARVLSAALNCPNKQDSEPCGECSWCLNVWKIQSTSVIEIDAASSDTVEAVHKLKELTYYAHEGSWRVIILDEAHSMSDSAFNVLLKTLEEPPENTVFVLATTEVFKIPNTIRTRSMQFEFRRISYKIMVERLQIIANAEGYVIESEMLDEIAKNSKGSLRDAIMQLDQASIVSITSVEEFREKFSVVDNAPAIIRAALSSSVSQVLVLAEDTVSRTGDAGKLLLDLTELLRDLLVLKSGGHPTCLPSLLEERTELASMTSSANLIAGLKVLWNAQGKVEKSVDQLTAAQVVCSILAEALKPLEASVLGNFQVGPISKMIEPTIEKPLSLAEMMQEAGSQV